MNSLDRARAAKRKHYLWIYTQMLRKQGYRPKDAFQTARMTLGMVTYLEMIARTVKQVLGA